MRMKIKAKNPNITSLKFLKRNVPKQVSIQRQKKRNHPSYTDNTCLDLLATAHMDTIYPLICCHLTLDGHIDKNRLAEAIQLSSSYVPEILYVFDPIHGRFVDNGLTSKQAFLPKDHVMHWDFRRDTQLKIRIRSTAGQDHLTIGINHGLSDSIGFLQYLSLLTALYNGTPIPSHLRNHRELIPYLKKVRIQGATEQEKNTNSSNRLQLPGDPGGRYQLLTVSLNPGQLRALHKKAEHYQATVNDVLLTAYARVTARFLNSDRVLLPCPANLRPLLSTPGELTVVNLTGLYRVAVELHPQHSFTETLVQIHTEMLLQKSRNRCLSGIKPLSAIYRLTPYLFVKLLCRLCYRPLPISYTNIGEIHPDQLRFKDCPVLRCYLSGAFRKAPDFQLTVSTYQNTCTLSSSFIGSPKHSAIVKTILHAIKQELLTWSKEAPPFS